MKKLKKLALEGSFTPLQKTEEGLLRGGFGEVDTEPLSIQPRGMNVNCSIGNNKPSCNNQNCSCTCRPAY